MKILFPKTGVPEHVFQRDPAIPGDMLMPCYSLVEEQIDRVKIIHRVRASYI